MPHERSDYDAFRAAEKDGWHRLAENYDLFTGRFTIQVLDDLMVSAEIREGSRVVDIACGPGYASAKAASLGADTIGVDIAEGMLSVARMKNPELEFILGNAESLPFEGETFSAAVCSFGLMHMGDPDKAIAEFSRVLARRGRLSFTVWAPAGSPSFFSHVFDAIGRFEDKSLNHALAPPMFRFADATECKLILSRHGFCDIRIETRELMWTTTTPESFVEYIHRSSIRMAEIINAQRHKVREDIHNAIIEGARQFLKDGVYCVPWPAVLVSAAKA